MLGRISERSHNRGDFVLLHERARGAIDYALTAAYAGGIGYILLESAAYLRIEAAIVGADDAHRLHLIAYRYAATAKYALAVVSDKAHGRLVLAALVLGSCEFSGVATQLVSQRLQLAVGITRAAEALLIMVG